MNEDLHTSMRRLADAQRRRFGLPVTARPGANRPRATTFSSASKADIDLSTTNEQLESVLFGLLPVEIRARIFEYALTPDDNLDKSYLPDRVYYRPGHRFHQKIDIALLLTCKKILSEARLMPVAEAEHTFWLFGGPYSMMKTSINGMARFDAWMSSLNHAQQQSVKHVRLYAQQLHWENMGVKPLMPDLSVLTAKHFTLVFRHSDWWSWESPAESSDQLGICPWLPGRVTQRAMLAEPLETSLETIKAGMRRGAWGLQIGSIRGLDTFRIEFEIDIVKKGQLDIIVERAKHWRFPLQDDNRVLVHTGQVREWHWEGLADLKHDNMPMLRVRSADDPSWNDLPKRKYHVVEMTWKRTRVDE
jgi:hypothetical protein